MDSSWQGWFEGLLGAVGESSWIGQVFLAVVVTLLASLLQELVLRRLHLRAKRSANIVDDTVILALQGPVRLLVWVLGLSWAVEVVARRSDSPLFDIVDPLRLLSMVAIISWFLVRVIRCLSNRGRKMASRLTVRWRMQPASCCAHLWLSPQCS